jgi:hypothetical protein
MTPKMSHARRIFLLSPAYSGGRRASLLMREAADFPLAHRLRQGQATIGEVYSFMSGLYFRGKVAYVGAFGATIADDLPSALVIVPGMGLLPPQTGTNIEQLRLLAGVDVDEGNPAYRNALVDAAQLLDEQTKRACSYVLLGSVASAKYTDPLLQVFGERLLFPADFVGRGDMSRGGLMLRSARSGVELLYIPVQGATLRGSRPARLERDQTSSKK